jgi:hypothetical protein
MKYSRLLSLVVLNLRIVIQQFCLFHPSLVFVFKSMKTIYIYIYIYARIENNFLHLPVVLYGCEDLSLRLKDHLLNAFA